MITQIYKYRQHKKSRRLFIDLKNWLRFSTENESAEEFIQIHNFHFTV